MSLLKNSGYGDAPAYRLWVALILSLLLHSALLTKLGPSSQNHGSSNHLLQVRLVTPTSPAPKPVEPKVAAPTSPIKLQPETLRPMKPPAKMTLPSSVSITQRPPLAETPQQVERQSEISVPNQNAPASWAEIEFEVFSGSDKKLIGAGLQHYESDGLGQYMLSFKEKHDSAEQAQNNSWQLEIAGRITRRGLSPSNYQRQGNVPEQLMALDNTPATNTKNSNEPQAGRMPDGILDRQSLLFQFMFSPPTDNGNGEILLTDGDKFRPYNYRTESMEVLDIKPQGAIRTLHLILSGIEHTDTIEVWLAPEFRYLPVKVRHTSSNGDITEQVATTINFR